jgi:hypothetical protein
VYSRQRKQRSPDVIGVSSATGQVIYRQLGAGSEMTDLQKMSRILYHHDWANVEDWARNITQLADLTDEEIVQLECCCSDHMPAGHGIRHQSAVPGREMHRSLIMRTRQRVAAFCDGLGLRRAY